MQVILKQDWFSGNKLYRRGADGSAIEIPDEYVGRLPTTARVVDAGPPVIRRKDPTLRDLDFERERSADEQRVQDEADAREARSRAIREGIARANAMKAERNTEG